jgi:hypothetical protein
MSAHFSFSAMLSACKVINYFKVYPKFYPSTGYKDQTLTLTGNIRTHCSSVLKEVCNMCTLGHLGGQECACIKFSSGHTAQFSPCHIYLLPDFSFFCAASNPFSFRSALPFILPAISFSLLSINVL